MAGDRPLLNTLADRVFGLLDRLAYRI